MISHLLREALDKAFVDRIGYLWMSFVAGPPAAVPAELEQKFADSVRLTIAKYDEARALVEDICSNDQRKR
jgi:hypothetical protein